MKAEELQQVRPGFTDPCSGSQSVFRTALSALSHPGRVIDMPQVSSLPRHGHGAAAMLLQALVDSDCRVWLSPLLANTDAANWLRFHTGCAWADSAASARFIWLAQGDAFLSLSDLQMGTGEYPDQSATCVVEVPEMANIAIDGACPLLLEGPGIQTEQAVWVRGLPSDFTAQWEVNHSSFPCGIDLLLATQTQLMGLPRTTRVRAIKEV